MREHNVDKYLCLLFLHGTSYIAEIIPDVIWNVTMLGAQREFARHLGSRLTTEYNDLEKDEVNIISGALELRKKTVKEVMTRLEDIFMLDYNSVLDFETVSEIMKQGYSRIPVYEGSHSNIVTVLYIKDLAFVDPDDNTPLKTLCKFYQNPCNFVFEDMTLDIMFKQFKEGIKGHMAFVHRVNSEGEGDPFYETVGLITLEDVIEELIQAEIVDETDVWNVIKGSFTRVKFTGIKYLKPLPKEPISRAFANGEDKTDNRSKRRRNEKSLKQDFTVFAERRENQTIHISPQLTLAMFQYLNTNVDAFKPETISETILRRLLKQDVLYHIKVKNKEKARHDPATLIYTQGKAVDYFVLIVEGRVEVMVGRECLEFESGPFTYFGTQALTQNIGRDGWTWGQTDGWTWGQTDGWTWGQTDGWTWGQTDGRGDRQTDGRGDRQTDGRGDRQTDGHGDRQTDKYGDRGAESPTATPANIGSLQSVNLDTILRHTFVPDYTVRAITEVFYIRIKRSLYLAAKRATLMERARKTSQSQTDDHFDDEVEKLLHSLEDDERSQGPNDPPTLSTTARDDRDYQSEKESLNRAIAAAERSPGGLSNDITALVSSMSPRGASSPASVGGSPGLVLNPNGKLGVPRSPGKSPSKQTPSPKETTGSTEERTVLLPKGQS
uniref:Cyclic nucleotide-binding domain-containing protein n=1 Tax=Timema monikensis TaxID=170555 RepID=A0A7R9HQ23_9NEOP|nr:unnamed protein product [Timema monikensis]